MHVELEDGGSRLRTAKRLLRKGGYAAAPLEDSVLHLFQPFESLTLATGGEDTRHAIDWDTAGRLTRVPCRVVPVGTLVIHVAVALVNLYLSRFLSTGALLR